MTTNYITYQGKVTIKVRDNKPVKRNNKGTPALFAVLCNILAKNYTNQESINNVPSFIQMLRSPVDDADLNISSYNQYKLLIDKAPIIKSEVRSNSPSVVYSALISYNQLASDMRADISGNNETCNVVLLNSNGDILAYAPFEFSDIANLWNSPNSQGSVDWEMFFGNNIEEK